MDNPTKEVAQAQRALNERDRKEPVEADRHAERTVNTVCDKQDGLV
ncbi:MAG: hypothetical protein M0R22_10715 [Dehalococcoidia bacterium]|nr:hypothetical protein [Dehalococcoidia bacterium]